MQMSELPSDGTHFLLFFRNSLCNPPPPHPHPSPRIAVFPGSGRLCDLALGKHDRRSCLQTAVENLSSSFWRLRSRVEKKEQRWSGAGGASAGSHQNSSLETIGGGQDSSEASSGSISSDGAAPSWSRQDAFSNTNQCGEAAQALRQTAEMFPTTAETPGAPSLGPHWVLARRLWHKNPLKVDPDGQAADPEPELGQRSDLRWCVRKLTPDLPAVCTITHHTAPSSLVLEQLESGVYCSGSPEPESDPTPRFSVAHADSSCWLCSIAGDPAHGWPSRPREPASSREDVTL